MKYYIVALFTSNAVQIIGNGYETEQVAYDAIPDLRERGVKYSNQYLTVIKMVAP